MTREIVRTDKAPAAIGPYSQAVKAGGFLFTAGQIPLDPRTGTMVEGDVAAQARRCLDSVAAAEMAALARTRRSGFRLGFAAVMFLTAAVILLSTPFALAIKTGEPAAA